MKNKKEFYKYLITVGIRSHEYSHSDKVLFDNIDYFKECWEKELSSYKALLFLHDHLEQKKCNEQKSCNNQTITDGCGSFWSKKCLSCGRDSMQVMRPGKVQCEFCG